MRPPESWAAARVTLAVGIATFVAWLLAWGSGYEDFIAVWGGFIPARIGGLDIATALPPVWLTPLTATLVHAGLIHLGFNLLILVFCGRAVEGILGGKSFLLLYLVGAYAAATAHYLANPGEIAPMVGASGAVSAVLGVYAVLFGRNRVKVADPRLAVILHALWLAAAWVVLQIFVGLTFETAGARIAIFAHIGGFLAGLLLARPLLLLRWRGA